MTTTADSLTTAWENLQDAMRRSTSRHTKPPATGSAVGKVANPIVTHAVIGEASAFTPTVCTGTPPLIRTFRYQMDAVDVGAQDAPYNPVDADLGNALRVIETISNQYGSVTGTSAGVAVTSGAEQYIVGQTLYVNLPSGMVGTIQIQRNGVSIPGALSAAGVGSYAYTIVAADADCALTPLVTSITWDTVAPRRFSTAVQIAEPSKIVVTYDENLDTGSVPATGDFALSGTLATAKTISSVAVVDNLCKITCSSNFVPGDQPIISYTPGTNKLRDQAHTPNNAAAFSGIYVFNSYPPPATAGILPANPNGYSAGGGGFVNAGIGGNFGYPIRPGLAAFGTHNVRLEEEGWIEMQVADSNAAIRQIGLYSQGGSDYLTTMPQAARLVSGAVRAYVSSTAVGSPYTFSSPSALCLVRLYRATPVGTLTMDTSEDGGITWTTRYTFAATDNTQMVGAALTNSASIAMIGVALENFEDLGF